MSPGVQTRRRVEHEPDPPSYDLVAGAGSRRTGVDSGAARYAHVACVVAAAARAARVVPLASDAFTGAVLCGAWVLARVPEAHEALAASLRLAAAADEPLLILTIRAALELQFGLAGAVLFPDRLASLAPEGTLAGPRARLRTQIDDSALAGRGQFTRLARHVRADRVFSGAIESVDGRADEPRQKNDSDRDQRTFHGVPPFKECDRERRGVSLCEVARRSLK
jgi:hypothetical protein